MAEISLLRSRFSLHPVLQRGLFVGGLALAQYALLMILLAQGHVVIDRPVLYHGLRLLLAALVTFLALMLPDAANRWAPISAHTSWPRWTTWLFRQISLFLAALACGWLAVSGHAPETLALPLAALSYLGIGAAMLLLLAIVAPLQAWVEVARAERYRLALSFFIALTVFAATLYSLELWSYLVTATFNTSRFMLQIFFDSVVSDPSQLLLGVDDFKVRVLAWCSGIEGMTLAAIFTSLFLLMYRHNLRFPAALLLLPASMLAMWILNNVRIVALIAIGAKYSPDLAIGAFHSNAGWIAFIFVEIAILAVAYKYAFTDGPADNTQALQSNGPVAMILPCLTLFAAILLSQALTDDFPWLYPLRVLACGVVLALFWPFYRDIIGYRPSLIAIGTGALVFVAWIVLVPATPATDAAYRDTLSTAATLPTTLWIFFRVAGAVIIAPVAEELLFRGYLLARLAREEPSFETPPRFSVVAIAVSSLAFGLLHGAWIAATLAGLAYALVRYRKRGLWDAVTAHATTNLLLVLYVWQTGYWSVL